MEETAALHRRARVPHVPRLTGPAAWGRLRPLGRRASLLPPVHTACELRELSTALDPLAAFEQLRGAAHPWLLDSALVSAAGGEGCAGRFSFAGADPYLVLRARGGRVELDCRRAVRPGLAPGRRTLEADAFDALRGLLPALPPAPAPIPFLGGAVGCLAYELAGRIESHVFSPLDDVGAPDATLLFADRLLAFDRRLGRAWVSALGFGAGPRAARAAARRAADELCARLEAPLRPAPAGGPRGPARPPFAFFDEASYAKAVEAALEEIAAGEFYQVCLTHRLERDYRGSAWELYRCLRRISPAPFACYLELPDLTVVGSSPERFLRLGPDRRVESRPIKGTRPRGSSPAEDAALRRELETSEKERAENLMIVDLVRSDLGRVCETGSVEVPELLAIETYAPVFQLVSTVRGRLRGDRDVVDLVRAAFPPGSMTGAPRIAAMRALARLEPVRRGLYSGAIGYFDARGGADLSVAIRTILLRGGRAYVHVGGGIVADSQPRAEYLETLDKARPLLAALEEASGRRIAGRAQRGAAKRSS